MVALPPTTPAWGGKEGLLATARRETAHIDLRSRRAEVTGAFEATRGASLRLTGHPRDYRSRRQAQSCKHPANARDRERNAPCSGLEASKKAKPPASDQYRRLRADTKERGSGLLEQGGCSDSRRCPFMCRCRSGGPDCQQITVAHDTLGEVALPDNQTTTPATASPPLSEPSGCCGRPSIACCRPRWSHTRSSDICRPLSCTSNCRKGLGWSHACPRRWWPPWRLRAS